MGLVALYLLGLPGPGITAVSPALAGRCLTTEPPGRPNDCVFYYPLYPQGFAPSLRGTEDFPSGSAGKESACNAGGLSLIPG